MIVVPVPYREYENGALLNYRYAYLLHDWDSKTESITKIRQSERFTVCLRFSVGL